MASTKICPVCYSPMYLTKKEDAGTISVAVTIFVPIFRYHWQCMNGHTISEGGYICAYCGGEHSNSSCPGCHGLGYLPLPEERIQKAASPVDREESKEGQASSPPAPQPEIQPVFDAETGERIL